MQFDDNTDSDVLLVDDLLDIINRQKKIIAACDMDFPLKFIYVPMDDLKALVEAALNSIEC